MSENVLNKIIDKKTKKIEELKKNISLKLLEEKINEYKSFYNFKEKIEKNIKNNKFSIIAEIKKASPSAGIIINNYDPVNIANIYKKNNATCLSVLTEEDFFLGNLLHISKIKQKNNLPILCKDFFVDKFQVYLARSYGADAILIILAGISDELADSLYEEAQKLNISVIVEVHTVDEAKKALKYKNAMIGINNRNLKTLKIDLNNTIKLSKLIPNKYDIVCESGLNTNKDLRTMEKLGINKFLVGESLMKNKDIENATKDLLKKYK